MRPTSITRRGLLAAGLSGLAAPALAQTEAWPNRPIRLVIPFGAGGSVDVVGRLLAEKLAGIFGQPLVIDNRPGGATSIGAIHVARSAPDGYTLFYGTPATQIINPSLFTRLNYDPDHDLVAIGSVMRAPNLLLVHPSLGVRDVPGLIEKAKALPGRITYASTAIGSSNHLSGEMLNRMAGIQLMHVPFSNFGLSAGELMAGRVDAYFGTISDMLRVSAGTDLVKLAVTSAQRSSLLPDVPTVAETVPGFEATAYNYIAVPPRTPSTIVMALNAGFNRALADPHVVREMVVTGLQPIATDGPDEAQKTIMRERERWRQVIQAAGIRLE